MMMYTLKSSVIIGSIVVMLLIPTTTTYVSASQGEESEQTQTYIQEEKEIESGFYRDDGYPKATEDRPAINPDFAPDESCDLKWELKCIPGSQQSCFDDLEGYNNFEMNVCTPIGCPEGYHDNFEWEDNVCYSNEKVDCQDDYLLVKGAYGDTCEPPFVCEHPENRDQAPCIEYCEENPDNSACDPEERAENNAIRDMSCDGVLKPYLVDLPKLKEDECYGTCEMPNRQLECDILQRN